MKEEVNVLNCDREHDLIAFLYGELNDLESRAFERHMRDCGACGRELDALKDVRHSVIAWRDESLGGAMNRRQRSASAALREFFSLSPFWMKGALAFATVIFCLFAGLVVARWRDVPPATVVTDVNRHTASEQELNALVEQRVQEELHRIKSAALPTSNSSVAVESALPPGVGPRIKRDNQLANNLSDQKARRPLSSIERAQLASDLRLVPQGNDSELDLLDDAINK